MAGAHSAIHVASCTGVRPWRLNTFGAPVESRTVKWDGNGPIAEDILVLPGKQQTQPVLCLHAAMPATVATHALESRSYVIAETGIDLPSVDHNQFWDIESSLAP
jgi:hypothetical protein